MRTTLALLITMFLVGCGGDWGIQSLAQKMGDSGSGCELTKVAWDGNGEKSFTGVSEFSWQCWGDFGARECEFTVEDVNGTLDGERIDCEERVAEYEEIDDNTFAYRGPVSEVGCTRDGSQITGKGMLTSGSEIAEAEEGNDTYDTNSDVKYKFEDPWP